jgi:hypothetical protein
MNLEKTLKMMLLGTSLLVPTSGLAQEKGSREFKDTPIYEKQQENQKATTSSREFKDTPICHNAQSVLSEIGHNIESENYANIDLSKVEEALKDIRSCYTCGEGTEVDTNTNLCWRKDLSETIMNWYDAHTYCEGLNLGGHNDWRLPNHLELIDVDSNIFTKEKIVWTSTEYKPQNTAHAWLVRLGSGHDYGYYFVKTYSYYVACVR